MSNYIDQFSELLSNPLGDLISSIGRGVGEAQAALDAGSLAQTLEIYRVGSDDTEKQLKLLREIGYQPTFYTIPETECEAQVSLSLGITGSEQMVSPLQNNYQNKAKMYATPMNAGNINRYNLNANASAKIKFKIVPVPTDAVISEMRILPNLVGKNFKEAQSILASIGLNYKLLDNVKEEDIAIKEIKETNPKFNVNDDIRLRLGDVIELYF